MAELLGRDFILTKGSVAIAGCRTKSFTVNNAPVDITSDDSAGVRELLDAPGEKTVEISFSGVATDTTIVTAVMSTTDVVDAYSLAWGGSTLSGNFFLASVAMTGEYNGAVTFEATLQSAGEITFA